jgi:hypothetical protein
LASEPSWPAQWLTLVTTSFDWLFDSKIQEARFVQILFLLLPCMQTLDEKRRLSFCGTDQYMSPEIMLVCPDGLPRWVYFTASEFVLKYPIL